MGSLAAWPPLGSEMPPSLLALSVTSAGMAPSICIQAGLNAMALALGFKVDVADVPEIFQRGIRELPGVLQLRELERNAQAFGHSASDIGQDTQRIALRRASRNQKKVRQIDCGAKDAGGRKFSACLFEHESKILSSGENQ